MSRFSDSPYFILKDFMKVITSPADTEYILPDVVNMYTRVSFTDVIWVGGETSIETSTQLTNTLDRHTEFDSVTDDAIKFEGNDVVWNAWMDRSPVSMYYSDTSLPHAGLLRGGDNYGQIVVDGGSYVNMYAKLDEYGFVPVRLKPLYEDPEEKKYFRFDLVEVSTITMDGSDTTVYDSDDGADEPYYDSEFVSIQTKDYEFDISPIKWGNLQIDDILQNGVELYFRKDSSFHDWMKEFAEDYYETEYEIDFVVRNYVNTDKRFLYFGEVFTSPKDNVSDPNRYHVVFNGLKDWVQAALPENNRTPNLVEFLDTYFDQVYGEGYQLLKDIWSLRDGRECDPKYLGYIPTLYDAPKTDIIPAWFVDAYREYADELIWLMKRKGTYASMYIIYSVFCGNSQNIFNVLERWHDDVAPITTGSEGFELMQTFDNPADVDTDYFGVDIDVSSLYTISGAEGDDQDAYNSGRAYIFSNETGETLHTLINPNGYDTPDRDEFGHSVAITDTHAAVGAWMEDDADGSYAGKVYVFNPSTGELLYTLDDPNMFDTSDSDEFGTSVALSENYLIVGAYEESQLNHWYVGAAYIFDVNTGTLLWSLEDPRGSSGYEYDYFGWSVGITDNYAIVGAYREGLTSGYVYIYDTKTGALLHSIENPNDQDTPNYDEFGWSVDISDTYAIVGAHYEEGVGDSYNAGAAYIFDVVTGLLVQTIQNTNIQGTYKDYFGSSVAISDTHAIIGSPDAYTSNYDHRGKAYVYDTSTWELIMVIEDTDDNDFDTELAGQVAISNTFFGFTHNISESTGPVPL